jgi:threonylcarbamoyladenosine tRNA methylthiotransferase MtaB
MRRRYDTAFFRRKAEKIKTVIPDAFIGVDVIVGTRGETDEYFEETRQFLESLDFSQLHVFTYSERPNTQALKIGHVVDHKTKHARCKALLNLSDRKLHAFYQSQQGTSRKVLYEHTRHDNMMYGFTENYVKVETPYLASKANKIKMITLGNFNNVRTALVEG